MNDEQKALQLINTLEELLKQYNNGLITATECADKIFVETYKYCG